MAFHFRDARRGIEVRHAFIQGVNRENVFVRLAGRRTRPRVPRLVRVIKGLPGVSRKGIVRPQPVGQPRLVWGNIEHAPMRGVAGVRITVVGEHIHMVRAKNTVSSGELAQERGGETPWT